MASRFASNGLGVSRVPPTTMPTVKTDAQLTQPAEGVGWMRLWGGSRQMPGNFSLPAN